MGKCIGYPEPPTAQSSLQRALCILATVVLSSLDRRVHSDPAWVSPGSTEHLNLSLTSSQGDGAEGNAVELRTWVLEGKALMSGFLEKYLF